MKISELPETQEPRIRRLFAFFVLSVLLVSTLLSVSIYQFETQSMQLTWEQTTRKKFHFLLKAVTASVSVKPDNVNDFKEIIRLMSFDDYGLVKVKLSNPEGNVLINWKRSDSSTVKQLSVYNGKVHFPGRGSGLLETAWQFDNSLHAIKTEVKDRILISVLALGLQAVIILILIVILVIAPIRKIHRLARKFLTGYPLDVLVPTFYFRELTDIYNSFSAVEDASKNQINKSIELTQAQEEIRELKKRSDLILNSAGAGIYILDSYGKIIFSNDAAIKLTGWKADESIGCYLHSLIQEPDRIPSFQKETGKDRISQKGDPNTVKQYFIYETILEGKKQVIENVDFYNKMGRPIPVRYVCSPIKENDRVSGAVLLFEDISVRMDAERRVKDSEALKKAMLASCLDAIITIDKNGFIREFNENAETMFGYKKNEVLSKPMVSFIMPERYRNAHLSGMKNYLENETDGILNKRIEISAIRSTGEEFPIELVVAPIYLHSELLFTGFIRDITDRKKANEALEHARSVAEKANLAKSQFLAAMSHEIRTPLNAMIGVTDLLMTTAINHEQSEYLKIAYQAGTSLQEVVDNILDFSKIEAGKMEMNIQRTEILSIVDSVLSIMGPKAAQKELDLLVTIDFPIPEKVFVDPGRFKQILLNLVSNAIKFTESGYVEIHLGAKQYQSGKSLLLVSIIDTGIGISEEEQRLIFEEFKQADLSVTRKYGGSGLGLAIVSRLVSLFGGEIGLESVKGQGSTFWFSVLPAVNVPSSPLCYEDLITYVFNDEQKSTQALFHYLKFVSQEAKLISALNEMTKTEQLCLFFVDEKQLPYFSFKQVDDLKSAMGLNCVMVLVRDIVKNQTEDAWLPYFDFHIVKPIQITQLNAFLKNCIDTFRQGNKLMPQQVPVMEGGKPLETGHTILLVEDSLANQLVIKSMLEKVNYNVEIAGNGVEALAKLNQHSYDVILMDLSMPIMGGLETTEKIRNGNGRNRKTPIIALTANAFEENRRQCYQAGMNGFLSKPLVISVLQQEIAKYLKFKPERVISSESSTMVSGLPEAPDEPIVNHLILEQLKAETSDNIFPVLLNIFLDQGMKRVDAIDQAIIKNDLSALASEIHSFKSESATFGATKLAAITAQIDLLCKQGNKDQAFNVAQTIRDNWQLVYSELQK